MNSLVIIAGGGIIGLAVGREILQRQPGTKVIVLEKEKSIALHQTGHNSGVIHSGIYYAPGSKKALACLEGARLLSAFCDAHGIARRVVGKVIVAAEPEELTGLEKIFQQGQANGIAGVRMISRAELREVEPAVTGLAAVHVPGVALVDYSKVCTALRTEIETAGGEIKVLRHVRAVSENANEVVVETDDEVYKGAHFINCGGLHCDRIARVSGVRPPARIIPFRGEYYMLASNVASQAGMSGPIVRGLVYPVPDPRFPFLGVHFTPTLDGHVTAGPNAVLALAREGYGWNQINVRDIAEYLTYSGFWRMAAAHWRTGLYELKRSMFKSVYAQSVRKFLPDLRDDDLLPGTSGVRAQAVDEKGTLINDFMYVERPRATHILNAPSPAATASLSIAKRIVDLLPSCG